MGEVGWNGWGVGRWAVANESSMSMLFKQTNDQFIFNFYI